MLVLPFPENSTLSDEDRAWLTRLVDDWQLLADLSFSDLVLWVPDADDNIFWAVAQVRPATGPTALEADVTGETISYDAEALVTEAYLSEEISTTSGNKLHAGIPVDQHAVPIIRGGRCVAILESHTNRMGLRAPGALEDNFLEISQLLFDMVWHGEAPGLPRDDDPAAMPRVGDGVIRVDAHGRIGYATPNAVTAYRKLGLTGDLEGEEFATVTRKASGGKREATDAGIYKLTAPQIADVSSPRGSLRLRVIPLAVAGQGHEALVLCRDTTELRDRERQLVTKDATIREIHHRVKNNLQTVAALLRMQARRLPDDAGRTALEEAMSRVSAIAIVHEILSQAYDDSVDFDDVCDRILRSVGALAAAKGDVRARREGTFGTISGDAATNLALILTEVCANAVEHGLASESGTVTVLPQRDDAHLELAVINDAGSLPEGFSLDGNASLGLSIVRTLSHDLGGDFELTNRTDHDGRPIPGTAAVLRVPTDGLLKRN